MSNHYGDLQYREKQSEKTRKNWEIGKYDFLIVPSISRVCNNPKCPFSFQVKPKNLKKYCSSRCAAIINNSKRPVLKIKTFLCLTCSKAGQHHWIGQKFCSNRCQQDYKYKIFVEKWKRGEVSGGIGISVRAISGHLRKYLLIKYNYKCSICFWDKRHPKTGHVPLEVDHIDGNAENNIEANLRILCPNCHSLTPSFRNLNKGKGRSWRLTHIKTQVRIQ